MAILNAETAQGFSGMPALRQLGFIIALAAAIAIGVSVAMWSQESSYSLLYGNLSGNDSSQVLDSLQKSNIPYKVDSTSGAIMVPADQIHNARLKLAADGLPKGNGVGFELFDKEQEVGTSKFMEKARYQHAVEIELARSIMTMRSVKNARIHLAVPKRSVFVRKNDKPTASVVLDLYAGHRLTDNQISSIVHMVSSSIPSLMPENVTVVDQSGGLLSRVMNDSMLAVSSSQFEYTKKLEENYKSRIEDLLSAVVGPGRVRAQVVADIDFTMTEKTLESYNPDLPALRSEQIISESSGSGQGVGGVPGALSNQPPESGSVNGDTNSSAVSGSTSSNNNNRTTRNYELDKTISHTRSSVGVLRKLSVAVLVDDLKSVGANGEASRTPLNDAAIARLVTLVKDAVGFDNGRGDSVNVINATFYEPEKQEALPELGIMEQAWVQDYIKTGVGVVILLILFFGVLKPVLKSMTDKGHAMHQLVAAPEGAGAAGVAGVDGLGEDQLQLQGAGQLPAPSQGGSQLAAAKEIVSSDPGRVAQVVKTWVDNDG